MKITRKQRKKTDGGRKEGKRKNRRNAEELEDEWKKGNKREIISKDR